MSVTVLFHIADGPRWRAALNGGLYAPPSSSNEGFIHLSTPDQLLGTLRRFYAGTQDLVLLVLDQDALGGALRWDDVEHADGSSATFPHLYRALAVSEAIEALEARDSEALEVSARRYCSRGGLALR